MSSQSVTSPVDDRRQVAKSDPYERVAFSMDDGDIVPEVDGSTFLTDLTDHPFEGPEVYRMDDPDGSQIESEDVPWVRLELGGDSTDVHANTPHVAKGGIGDDWSSGILPVPVIKANPTPVAREPPMDGVSG